MSKPDTFTLSLPKAFVYESASVGHTKLKRLDSEVILLVKCNRNSLKLTSKSWRRRSQSLNSTSVKAIIVISLSPQVCPPQEKLWLDYLREQPRTQAFPQHTCVIDLLLLEWTMASTSYAKGISVHVNSVHNPMRPWNILCAQRISEFNVKFA